MAKDFAVVCLLVMVLLTSQAFAYKACDSKDQGPYLATKPKLLLTLTEATQEELRAADIEGSPSFHTELRLHGQAKTDFTVSMTSSSGVLDLPSYLDIVHRDGVNYVKLVRALDRDGPTPSMEDDTNIVHFVLVCTPTNSSEAPQVYDASLLVDDVNDNDPVVVAPQSVTVSERLTPGREVVRLEVTDKDLNLDATPVFSLEQSDFENFRIDNMTGVVYLNSRLDYEAMKGSKYFDLKVTVKDGGPGVSRSSTAVVRVHVTREDDHSPTFVYDGCRTHNGRCAWPVYSAVARSITKGEIIKFVASSSAHSSQVPIKAKGGDYKPGSDIRFKVAYTVPTGLEGSFSVETTKGNIEGEYDATVRASRDITVKDGFQILLMAEEQGDTQRSSMALLQFYKTGNNNFLEQGGAANDMGNSDDDGDDYTDTEIGLAIATSVLAAFCLCAIFAIIYACRRSKPEDKTNLHMLQANTNSGFRE